MQTDPRFYWFMSHVISTSLPIKDHKIFFKKTTEEETKISWKEINKQIQIKQEPKQ